MKTMSEPLQDAAHATARPEDFLPFVRGQGDGRDYWHIHATGDGHLDHCIGSLYGMYLIEYLRCYRQPEILDKILRSMPPTTGKVEQGFRDAIGQYLVDGTVSLSGFDLRFAAPR